MKYVRTLLAAALLILPACSGTQRKPGPTRYRAWCNVEQKFLGEWSEDKAAVEKLAADHEKKWPTHLTRLQVD